MRGRTSSQRRDAALRALQQSSRTQRNTQPKQWLAIDQHIIQAQHILPCVTPSRYPNAAITIKA